MDSTGSFISATESIDATEFAFPAVVDLDTYIRLRLIFDRKQMFRDIVSVKSEEQKDVKSGALELEIPVRIKNETFTRIFGSDRVRLRVTGNISFDLSGRSEERSGSAVSAVQDQGTFSPRFNQTQQFTIEGKIGEKVTVSVEQNSEATFDFENTLKLRYAGDEDEIIQSIEAGNIGLSLPSTKYVIFGASNKGLFGIKAQAKIGNFTIAGIASLEKGEQKKLTISGSASESKSKIHDYDFIKSRYFFIDTYYNEYFEQGYSDDLTQWFYAGENRLIRELDVFKSASYAHPNKRDGIAVLNPREPQYQNLTNLDNVTLIPGEVEKSSFVPLERGKDYEYDYARGFFWLKQEPRDNEVLAIAYRTDTDSVGTMALDLIAAGDTTVPYILRLIKPKSLQPSHTHVWSLTMRNFYYLGGTKIEDQGFDLQIEYNLNGDHETRQTEDPKKSFLYLMGLDRLDENGSVVEDGDKKIDNNGMFVNKGEGILMFPGLQPFDPLPGSRFENRDDNEGLADTNLVRIYNISDHQERIRRTKFEIIVTSRSTKSTFDLGFNVLEGSEEVLLNGSPLKRNEDYIIDYFTGQITLISSKAKRASSNIEIKYEKATIFQLDKKSIFGGRAEYRFWEDSFVGFTALFMNKSTLDQRVRVGQEPFQNFVWDINTSLKFKPNFLTKIVDMLPLVETNVPSTLKVEAEFAQVLPSPNTLNNENTGDNDGLAFIDDFEGTKRSTTLGIRYNIWTAASPPAQFAVDPDKSETVEDTLVYVSEIDTIADMNRARITWFNPFNRVPIKNIWPNRDVNAETGQETDVLGVELWDESGGNNGKAWAGFMRSTASIANQQRAKFIEVWVKEDTVSNPNYIRINIDVGQISEDWYMFTCRDDQRAYGSPSWRGLNTEDSNINGVLDENEDTGVDGYPNGHPCDDPLDNWREPDRTSTNNRYDGINGTEGNSQSRAANYPDSEDLDGDGQVNLNNSYFTYSFTLDPRDAKSHGWLTGETVNSLGEKTGWKQYRIPIKEFDEKIGEPDETFQSVYFVRVWFSNITPEPKRIFFATMDFVGNEWEEDGIAESDTSQFEKNEKVFDITVYNTEENTVAIAGGPDPYRPPPGVSGIRDRITQTISKEQSMAMRVNDLRPDFVARANKSLFGQILSLVNYKRIKMFVYGDSRAFLANPAPGDSSKIEVFLRFGSDDNNYYEYGQKIYKGWNPLNEFDIDLNELSRTKFEKPLSKDYYTKAVPGKKAVDGYYVVSGKASLNTIRYFKIGIRNKSDGFWSGEVWFDELRVSDVRQESGTALRLSASLRLADVLTFNGNWESKDADFHDIKTQFGSGNTLESQNYSGVFNLHKFLPEILDFSLPIDGRASHVRNIPKYFPRTDILTGYRNATIEDKMKSLIGMREISAELDTVISESKVFGLGTTIKKKSKSDNFFIRNTIDQITLDVDFSYRNNRDYRTEFSESKQWSHSISYSIPFGTNNFIEPFKILEPFPIISLLANQKIYYTPKSTSMSLSMSDVKQANKLRSEDNTTSTVNVSSSRRISIGYQLIPSINLSITRSHKADADFVGINSSRELLQSIIDSLYFGRETDISQGFKVDYRPKWFTWFTPDYSYSSNFRYYFSNLAKGQKQTSSKVSHRINLSLSPGSIVNLIYSPVSEKTTARRGSRPRPQPGQTAKEEDSKEEEPKDQEEEEEGSKIPRIPIPNPLMWVYHFFDSWEKIQTSLTINNDITNSYVQAIPTWEYQFGFSKDPGVQQDTSQTNGFFIGPSISSSKNLQTSLSFKIAKNVKTSFTHTFQDNQSSNDKTKSANQSITYFVWGDDPKGDFRGVAEGLLSFIPDWKVSITGIEQVLFFKDFAKSVSIDHSRNGKYSVTKRLNKNELVPATESFSHNFAPLLGVNISWKFGMSTSIRMNQSSTLNFTSGGGATRSENNTFSVTASYKTQGGFQIPIPIWPFKNQVIKNDVSFSLTFDKSSSLTFQKQISQKEFQETQKNNTWKLRPSATYRFNQRVSGSLFYETGVTENKISGKYSWNEFGITVNIAIRD